MKELSIEEFSNKLSISTATAKNWLKLGKITPQFIKNNKSFFSENYTANLLEEISRADNNLLKSRRNKNYIKGKFFYKDYLPEESQNLKTIEKIIELLENTQIFNENLVNLITADCAIQLILQSKNIQCGVSSNFLLNYINKNINLGIFIPLIDFFLPDEYEAVSCINKYPSFFDFKFIYEKGEDILGLLYISCSNMDKRKQRGMYYTPTKVVKNSIENLVKQNKIMPEDKILDCCCGTGNFLQNLPDNVNLEQIYGNDIDSISGHIAKINLAMKYEIKDLEIINSRFSNSDFLTEYSEKDFKYIIGNPPWGYCFTQKQKENLAKKYLTANGKNIESFDLFIEKSLSILKKDGVLSFVLPESVLNVKSHTTIRKIIKEENSIQYLQYLGNIFNKVHCPGIILQVKHTQKPITTTGMRVNTGKNQFEIKTDRKVDIKNFSLKTNDREYEILQKILNPQNKKYLKDNADFALGIVTGNNKKYLSAKKTSKNEVIIKGTDIEPYKIKEGGSFIEYYPENFQQCAPVEYYRPKEKLVYKFISSKPVFAYDNAQRLTLNSCNILIPHIKSMDIKYILAVLNSSFAQYIYKKEINSIKVLRSHLEQIPLPVCHPKNQQEIVQLVDQIIAVEDIHKYKSLYDIIDEKIRKLYGINSEDYYIVRNCDI